MCHGVIKMGMFGYCIKGTGERVGLWYVWRGGLGAGNVGLLGLGGSGWLIGGVRGRCRLFWGWHGQYVGGGSAWHTTVLNLRIACFVGERYIWGIR